MNAAQHSSIPAPIGGVLEKCFRISPDLYYTIDVEGELAMPRSGRRSFRPTANSPGPAPQGLKMSDDSILCSPGVGEFFRILPLLSAAYRPWVQYITNLSFLKDIFVLCGLSLEGKASYVSATSHGTQPAPKRDIVQRLPLEAKETHRQRRSSSWVRAAAHSSAVSTSSGSGTPACRSS